MEGVSPEAVFLLGKDLNSFKEIAQGLLDGSPELRLPGTQGSADPRAAGRADQAVRADPHARPAPFWATCRAWCRRARRRPRSLPTANRCAAAWKTLQDKLSAQTGLGAGALLALLACRPLFALLCAGGLRLCAAAGQPQAPAVAEAQRLEAERQEQEAKRVNDANQAAILRLMNELQTVAEGDLTQEATVTEDITGAIADSVNYTVEELRSLVGNVQNTATRVAQTTAQVEEHVDRTAGRLDRAAARDSRNRPVGAGDGQPNQRGVGAGAGIGPGGAPVAAGRRVGPAGGAEHHRRHELDPRPDPGNLQAHQAAGRVVAGDRRNHRADFRHYRTDQRAGAERRHPGRVGR